MFDNFLRCVWCIILLQKGKHCGVFKGEGCNARNTFVSVCLQPYVTKLGIVVHHHEPECHAKKKGILSSRSRAVWAYIIKL